VIASAESMPAATLSPRDIITMYDGKHVEIINTDAEGRMVLGDASPSARRDLKAAAIVDLATLTGACGVALGDYAAGFWSSDDQLKDRVLAAARGGRPKKTLAHADLRGARKPDQERRRRSSRISGGRLAALATAAAFLQERERHRLEHAVIELLTPRTGKGPRAWRAERPVSACGTLVETGRELEVGRKNFWPPVL